MSDYSRFVRPNVRLELAAARDCAKRKDFATSFRHLERAHVLSQASTRDHVWVHCRMLSWAMQQRDTREIGGQVLRIFGAATKTALGLVPLGNTGGSNVGPFRRMPIPKDLAGILAVSTRSSFE
jgi:hypothetical protein